MYPIIQTAVALLLSIVCHAGKVTIPLPIGMYNVTTTTLELVDQHRPDPFVPASGSRRIMVSSFFPITRGDDCIPSPFPYMPIETGDFYDGVYASYGLPNGTFGSLQLNLCQVSAPRSKKTSSHYPVVIFSPGLGNSRLIYSGIAASFASKGYAVLTIDHPYDASIVEFPDGSVVYASNVSTDQQIEYALEARVQDISFLATQLHNISITQNLFPGGAGSVSTKQLFAAGHSLGGAAAASVMANDTRFKSGVNLDGTFFGPVIQQGLTKPFLMMAHEGKNLSTDASWAKLWPHLHSLKVLAGVNRTVHASFTDLPLLADALNLTRILPSGSVEELIGKIPGQRMVGLIGTCMKLFFELIGGKTQPRSFQQSLTVFPEISIMNATFEHCEIV